jgi:hypothetical protein
MMALKHNNGITQITKNTHMICIFTLLIHKNIEILYMEVYVMYCAMPACGISFAFSILLNPT